MVLIKSKIIIGNWVGILGRKGVKKSYLSCLQAYFNRHFTAGLGGKEKLV